MKWLFVWLIGSVVNHCAGQIASAKNATLMCVKLEATNELRMAFNVLLNTDPVGGLWALNNSVYANNQNIAEVTCTKTFNSTYGVYTVESKVDLSSSSANDDNVCGRITKTDNGVTVYEWLFIHIVVPPANSSYPLLIQDRDRVYRLVCRMDNLTSNVVSSSVTVETPNLDVVVTPSALPVNLTLQSKSGSTYTDVSGNQAVQAGSLVRLKGVFERNSPYTQNIDVHSVYFYNATVRGNATSNSYILVDDNGCANVNASNNQPPFFPKRGFKGLISGTNNVHVTGDFIVWKFDEFSQLIFQVYFKLCFEPNIDICTDPCKANTNFDEPATRRRRQVRDEEPGVLTVVINVKDSEEPTRTAESSSDVTMMVIVGATVGGAVVVVVALLVCIVVMKKRGNYKEKGLNSDFMRTNYPGAVTPYWQKY